MKKIQLTKNKVALVDARDYPRLSKFNWHTAGRDGLWYAARWTRVNGRRHLQYMHREIVGAKVGDLIDHRDGDGLHNWRTNLRHASYQQNGRNAVKRDKNASSQFKGVSWHVRTKLWRSYIRTSEIKHKHLGAFISEKEAALAYDAAAKKFHGGFARLNYPLEGRQ